MSITSAFAIGRSGLSSVEKWAEVTSGNIANADRAGYTKKTMQRGTDPGGGVQVIGIRRESDDAVERLHRIELSRAGRQEAVASGLELYTTRLGQPGDAGGLVSRIDALQSAFTQLANAPEQLAMQSGALEAAKGAALALNDTAAALGEAASLTRDRIGASVATLNEGLGRIAELNRQIAQAGAATDGQAALMDEAGAILDRLSGIADLRAVPDGQGRLTVHTAGGTPLVENTDARTIRYDDATGSLLADGIDITPDRAGARGFSEGRLAGEIHLFGQVIPKMQLQLDEAARALMQGFAAADASRAPGQPGLFTDAGAAFDPLALDGLAGRIAVNDAVIPEAGGAIWRLRDGVGAALPGAPGDPTQPGAFVDMLEGTLAFDPAAGLETTTTLSGFAASLVADQQQMRVSAQARQETLMAGAASLEAVRSAISGVNRDEELQRLIEIEQSYAANSQVIRTLTEMVDTLLAAF
jgi:flagellar hook-associated protein 1 FlgK